MEPAPPQIEISLNGAPHSVAPGSSVEDLIEALGYKGLVAVERNREVVARADRATTRLEADDQIEIVTLVGGG